MVTFSPHFFQNVCVLTHRRRFSESEIVRIRSPSPYKIYIPCSPLRDAEHRWNTSLVALARRVRSECDRVRLTRCRAPVTRCAGAWRAPGGARSAPAASAIQLDAPLPSALYDSVPMYYCLDDSASLHPSLPEELITDSGQEHHLASRRPFENPPPGARSSPYPSHSPLICLAPRFSTLTGKVFRWPGPSINRRAPCPTPSGSRKRNKVACTHGLLGRELLRCAFSKGREAP
jgi:hypothetical protein